MNKWRSLFVQWLGWFTVHLCSLPFDNGVRFRCTDHFKPYRHHRVDAVCSSQVSSHCCRYVTFLDIVNNYTGGKLYLSWSLPVNLYTRPICRCIPVINTTYLKILFIDESLDPLNHTLMLAVSKTQPDGWLWGLNSQYISCIYTNLRVIF